MTQAAGPAVGSDGGYQALLEARVRRTGTLLCLGLDPDPAGLPRGFGTDVAGVERFSRLLLDAALPHAAAVKVNLAFFEAFGSAGLTALERLRASLPADVPFIADAKRGDIGSTTARHAVALFDGLAAHAVTVAPYVGAAALAPLLERGDRCVYVLCRTSNPGAGELQDLVVGPDQESGAPGEPLYLRVARLALAWQATYGTVGLVVGATAAAELGAVRGIAPGLPFLVPGWGRRAATPPRCVTSRWPARDRSRTPPDGVSSSTSRAASPGRRPARPTPGRRSRRPPRTGRHACGATMSTRRSGRRWRILRDMPDIGAPELIIILVVALIVLGPKRLPEMGQSLGRSLREFRHAVSETTDAVKIGAAPTAATNPTVAPVAPPQPAPAAPANVVAAPADATGPSEPSGPGA